jgi:TRAP-type C4-dicarboxylate transport system substrate-binding protein
MNFIFKPISLFTLCIMMCISINVQAKTLKIATLAPAGTNWMKEMKAGASLIKERTEGRVKLKFYPGGVMGNDQSVHRKIKVGQLHGGAFTTGGLSQVYSSIQTYSLPMLYDNLAEIDFVRTSIEPVIKQRMEANGFVVLGISEGGFIRILSKQPMQDLESLQQSKVWIPEGDQQSQIVYKALGLSPIPLPISDVFTGLQTGLIDTVAITPTAALAFQWHTSTSYMTNVPISYAVGILALEQKSFSKLSSADQTIVREEMARVFERLDEINRSDNKQALEVLKKQGISFVMPHAGEHERWKAISYGSIEEMVRQGIIEKDIFDQVRSRLETLRSTQ